MKKHIVSSSRRKWIVGGGLFFGGLALLTTGFATWIVGMQIMNSNQQHGVTIDTALNESISISVKMSQDSSIHLAETISQDTTNSNQIVFTNGNETPDLSWVYESITIQCGRSYWEKNYAVIDDVTQQYVAKDFELDIALNYNNVLDEEDALVKDDITKNNLVKTENILLEGVPRKTLKSDESYTYIDLVNDKIKVDAGTEENSPATVQWVDKSGYKEITLTNIKVDVTWGTFFHLVKVVDDQPVETAYSPANFYNELAKDDDFITVGNVANVYNEFEAMVEAFTPSEGKASILSVLIALPSAII